MEAEHTSIEMKEPQSRQRVQEERGAEREAERGEQGSERDARARSGKRRAGVSNDGVTRE